MTKKKKPYKLTNLSNQKKMSICDFSELMDGAQVKEDNLENTSYMSKECLEMTYKKKRNYFTCKDTTKPVTKKLPTVGVKRRTTEEHDISKLIKKFKKVGINNREEEEKLGIEEGIESMKFNKNYSEEDEMEETGLISKAKVGNN